jgi:hypothetical protein
MCDACTAVAVYIVTTVLDNVGAVYARPEVEMALGEWQLHVAVMTNEYIQRHEAKLVHIMVTQRD